MINFLKRCILTICLLGQMVLIYQIGVSLFRNQNFMLFLLWYLVLEFVLHLLKEASITKIIISVCLKGQND